ncbi:MAG TPA: FGGY-family carbohydrate kinase [Solirubrobacteraceae bacterium]
MASARVFAAVDLGAESGRVVTGRLDGTAVALDVVHRFANRPTWLPDGRHWNVSQLFADALDGLARARAVGHLDGIGVDAWGVDYALLDGSHRMLGLPFHYRDERVTDEVMALTHNRVPRDELYGRTGIQTIPINTVYQLVAERGSGAAHAGEGIALIPDLINLWLTGELANETTIASTTGLLEATGRSWALDLIARLGIPERPFTGEALTPGRNLGSVHARHGDLHGIPVHLVGSHDTASAFVGAPLERPGAAVLSSGTWSLLGLEVREPVLGPDAAAYNLTNERGVEDTVRLLRNVMGLWLVQECRRAWTAAGRELGYDELCRVASEAPADVPLFDPDQSSLLRGGDMPTLIAAACTATGQTAPVGPGRVIRSILVSLACKYRLVLEQLQLVTGRQIEVVHVVGGGVRNTLLCQLTADLLGLPLLAGPEEATALGNVVMQARARGDLSSLDEMRVLVARSVNVDRYEPASPASANETYERFLSVTGLQAERPAQVAA